MLNSTYLNSTTPKNQPHKPRGVTVADAVEAWHLWTPEQRADFGQGVGVAELWDHGIAPLVVNPGVITLAPGERGGVMTIDTADKVRTDEARRILNETQDAISEVEAGVDQINELMVELILCSGSLSEQGKKLADDLGAEANALFAGLELQAEALRKEVAAATGDDDEDDEGA